MTKTVYRLENMNGRFDHAYGKKAAVARANEIDSKIDGEKNRTAKELESLGWTFRKVSAAHARSVGM